MWTRREESGIQGQKKSGEGASGLCLKAWVGTCQARGGLYWKMQQDEGKGV